MLKIQATGSNAMSRGLSSYTPKTGIGRWFDARLPLPRLVHDQFIVYPVPRNLNYAYSFGGILTMILGFADRDRDRAGHALCGGHDAGLQFRRKDHA
jgi:hypothetical protein